MKADLTEVPAILDLLVDDETLKNEIKLIKDLEGSATGRLVLGETTDLVNVVLDVSEINMFARYGRMPYPMEIQGGHFFFDETTFQIEDLRGKIQKSTFSDLSAHVKLEKKPQLEIRSGRFLVSLGDIYAWLSSIDEFKEVFKEIKSIHGTAVLSSIALKGPADDPQQWDFKVKGEVKKYNQVWTRIPGTVVLTNGKFKADPKTFVFSGAKVSMLDATMTVSGAQHGYLTGLQRMDFSFQADVGPEATLWIIDFVDLPSKLRIEPPFSISNAHLGWKNDGNISLSGALKKKGWPNVSIDMIVKPGELLIKELALQDEKSDAKIALNLKKGEFHLGFKGLLDKKTMDAILVENQVLTGWIEGDFEAHILKEFPMHSTAEGTIQGEGFGHPLNLKVPLRIDAVALKAVKNELEIKTASVTMGDSHLNLKGKVGFSEEDFEFDITVSADDLMWDEMDINGYYDPVNVWKEK